MKTKFLIPILCFTFSLSSCGDDDTPERTVEETVEEMNPTPEEEETPDPAILLAEERQTTITTLTSGSAKVWRINTAILNNENGAYDIGNNFNLRDDEFIFSSSSATGKTEFEGTLEWRESNAIAFGATSADEAKLESYVSPQTFTYDFQTDNGTTVLSENGNITLTVNTNNSVTGTINFSDKASMDVTLIEKLSADYKQVPSTTLNFIEAFTFESNGVDCCAPGMIGSLSNESFFFATRESALNNGTANPERVLRFDLNSNTVTERLYFNFDFVTKQMNIINDQLYIVGGQHINVYDLKLENEPFSLTDYSIALGQNIGLSRHGTAVVDNTIYLIGGDLNVGLGDKIFTYNLETQTMSEWATMPEPRSGARAEIVNGKLYIFGGTEQFFTPPAKNTIYIYDLETKELVIETMPVPVMLTYTGKIENLIYVGGRNDSSDTDENGETTFNRDPFLGVYDTNTGVFTQLETNLESPENEIIASMAVFDGKLFVVYGQSEPQEEGVLQTWSILSVDI